MRLDRPFRGSEAIAAGLVTARQLRGPRFRPLFRGIHVLADAQDNLETAVQAALLRHRAGVVAGTTAAALHGALDEELTGSASPVELVVATGARPAPGLLLRRDRLGPDEVAVLDGLALTTPLRTAFDVSRRLGTVDAVVVVEALARDHGVTLDDLRGVADEHPHERGLARARTAWAHVAPGARAGVETRVRLALVAAGLPGPEVGHVVLDAIGQRPLGVTDLAWPDLGCALLCDRDDHTARAMAGLLVELGWTVQRVDRERWRCEPDRVVENVGHMLRAQRRAQCRPEDQLARIVASWPSRARRRTAIVRLYP